jgi:lipid-A-disaccharide synthase
VSGPPIPNPVPAAIQVPGPPAVPGPPGMLFTAFEPSGDDHAATVIAELRRRHPSVPIYAWGGPKMERAGATIIEHTGQDAVMGVPGMGKIIEHLQVNKRVKEFVQRQPLLVHVPVDSPAANTPLASIAKRHGVKVVNLVAPQFWAWGPWRAEKLRQISDLVLCILPFEEPWFNARQIPARYVGHMLFDHKLNPTQLDQQVDLFPQGSPRVALMPGSRPKEIDRNWSILLNAYRRIEREFPGMSGMVAATTPAVEAILRSKAEQFGGWPPSLGCACGQTDAITRWTDLAIVVSGTVTLQIAKQNKPMIILYKTSRVMFKLIGSWLLKAEFFTLPNLIAGRRIVPEHIPYFGEGDDIGDEAIALLKDPAAMELQSRELAMIITRFRGLNASSGAADAIEKIAGLTPARPA